MSDRYLTTGEAAEQLGVAASTLRRWLADDDLRARKFPNLQRTARGHARIAAEDVERALGHSVGSKRAVAYVRVPSWDHRDLLVAAEAHLRDYGREQGYTVVEVIREIGPGYASDRPRLTELRERIQEVPASFSALIVERIDRLVVAGASEFVSWAERHVSVVEGGAASEEADAVYRQEVLFDIYYPLADLLCGKGYSPVAVETALARGLTQIATELGLAD